MTELDAYASRTYPYHYAGLVINDDGSVSVFRRKQPVFDADLADRFPSLTIRFVGAAHSRTELKDLARAVTADIDYWQARGIEITTVSTPPDGSRVKIGTPDPDAAAGPLLARYGSDRVEVVSDLGAAPL